MCVRLPRCNVIAIWEVQALKKERRGEAHAPKRTITWSYHMTVLYGLGLGLRGDRVMSFLGCSSYTSTGSRCDHRLYLLLRMASWNHLVTYGRRWSFASLIFPSKWSVDLVLSPGKLNSEIVGVAVRNSDNSVNTTPRIQLHSYLALRATLSLDR